MITMNSLISPSLYTSALVISLCFVLVVSPASCFRQLQPPNPSARGLSLEEKTRLGSTPPSCHNKCNGCHPCMAVQVPTVPSLHPFQPSGNQYSNYKPLGWKCCCGDHFYNP
ncbi:hypothetical protein PTKIN_Ptkin07bG0239000 [Pterospermum kingtungense]